MNVFDLYAKISLDSGDYEKGLKNAGEQMGGFANKLKGGLSVAAKVGGAAIAAAAAGFAALTKSAISNYAEYEQLVGGSQLMFGEAYDFIAEKAKNAFSTVQMSQNDYLKQANGFATGLKTALGGNEIAAANLADKIIQAEADIVAATGNSQEAVQNAFNGIMKSNYTMLDNLQIGITPTKEGFQEIIDKVNEWNAANGNATNYQISNLADAQSALVDYIEMVGMSGYAQAEAAGTIQGSLAMVKAAWENFLTGMADPSSDLDALINNLVDSVETVAEQLVPRILATVPRLLEGISALIGSLSQKLPGVINDVLGTVMQELPKIATMLSDMLIELVDIIGQNGGKIVDAAFKLVNNLIVGLTKLAPKLLKTVSQLAVDIVTSFAKNLPGIIQAASDFLVAFVEGLMDSLDIIIDSLPTIIEAIVDALDESIPILIDAVIAIVETVLEALPEILPKLVDAVSMLLTKLSEMITNRQDDFVRLFESIANALGEAIPALVTELTPAITTLIESLSGVITTLVPVLGQIGVQILTAIFSAFAQNTGAYMEAVGSLVLGLISVIGENAYQIMMLGTELLLAIGDAIIQCAQDGTLAAAGEALISGMWDAAVAVATSLGEALFGAIISGFNVGKNMNTPENFMKQQQELFGVTPNAQEFPLEGIPVIGMGSSGGGMTINQTINAPKMTPAQAFQEAKAQQLAAQWMAGGF